LPDTEHDTTVAAAEPTVVRADRPGTGTALPQAPFASRMVNPFVVLAPYSPTARHSPDAGQDSAVSWGNVLAPRDDNPGTGCGLLQVPWFSVMTKGAPPLRPQPTAVHAAPGAQETAEMSAPAVADVPGTLAADPQLPGSALTTAAGALLAALAPPVAAAKVAPAPTMPAATRLTRKTERRLTSLLNPCSEIFAVSRRIVTQHGRAT
jgi:hypothetical protein